ncbi:MAG: hypothetical protein Kow00127_12920 [Bacteroidales bacterium]
MDKRRYPDNAVATATRLHPENEAITSAGTALPANGDSNYPVINLFAVKRSGKEWVISEVLFDSLYQAGVGQKVSSLFHADLERELESAVRRKITVTTLLNPGKEKGIDSWFQIVPKDDGTAMIMARKQPSTELTLRSLLQAREKLISLRDTIPIGLFKIDRTGNILAGNKWLASILGADNEADLSKINLFELISGGLTGKEIEKILGKGEGLPETEVVVNRIDKETEEVYCVIRLMPESMLWEGAGGLDGYIYDISARKKALINLQEKEEFFAVITRNLKSTVFILNDEGKFLYVNPAMTRLTGYPEEELLEKSLFDFISEEYHPALRERLTKRIAGENEERAFSYELITADGARRWFEITAARMKYQGDWVYLGLGADITERRKALEEVRESEQKYRNLFGFMRLMTDNVPDMIWAKDLDMNYIFANKAMCEKILLTGNTDEPLGKNDAWFAEKARQAAPDNPQYYTFGEQGVKSDQMVINSRRPGQFEEQGYVNGELIILDVHKAPLWDEKGNMIGIVGSARDVTLTRKIEAEKEKEERIKNIIYRIGNAVTTTRDLRELISVIRRELSEVIDTTNMFIALYDEKTGELSLPYFADEKDRFTRIPKGKTLTHYMISSNKPLLLTDEQIYSLISNGEVEQIGSLPKVWMGVPLVVKGKTIGAIVVQNYHTSSGFSEIDLGLLNFVSLQISISINQKLADDALKESEFTLRQIVDNVPVMIFAKDEQLRYTLVNKTMASFFGKRVDQIEGKRFDDFHNVISECSSVDETDLDVLQSGKPIVIHREKITDSTGKTRILKTVKIPMNGGTGSKISILGVSMDMTDQIESERKLSEARDKAAEADRLKTAFLANMSHEIRTPMNAVIGFSELLNDPHLSDTTRREFIYHIGENSRQLLKLIETIIDVSKIEAGNIRIITSPCQVNRIMDELYYQFNTKVEKEKLGALALEYSKAVEDEMFTIEADVVRLKQVMSNLIDNAVKFTNSGTVEFGYILQQSGKKIRFYVKDTGIGIPEDKQEVIFERFRQAEETSTKEFGGTGLGLTLAGKIIELMGSQIIVDSAPGKGSHFYFDLPVGTEPAETEETESWGSREPTLDWTGKTILVAEDEESNFDLLNATLSPTGVDIIKADNGLEAVNVMENDVHVDLILMDIRMPVMDGYEATRRILKKSPQIPVVALTAYAMTEDLDKSRRAGCVAHISKPFNPNELLRKIAPYIE